MKWIFLLMALVLAIGCIGGGDTVATDTVGVIEEGFAEDLGSADYTSVEELPEGTLDSGEELGSGLEDEEIF